MNVAVLHVGEEVQSAGHGPVGACEEVGVLLVHVVVVPAFAAVVGGIGLLHPVQLAPMGTAVVAPRAAKGEIEVIRSVGRRGVHAAQMVAHEFFADQVPAYGDSFAVAVRHEIALVVGLVGQMVGEEVFEELGVVLVLLVVAVTVGVEGRGVQRPSVAQALAEDQLVVDLQVVVGLVVVEVHLLPLAVLAVPDAVGVGVRGGVHAAAVVTAAVETHLVARGAVVAEVGLGLAAERNQLEHRVAVVIAALEHVGGEGGPSAADVAVRGEARQACVHRPMAAHQPRRDVHGLFVGVVRSVRERDVAAELGFERGRGHIDRAAEGARAVGRDARAALDLHRADRRNQVGGVVPVHRVRVGVVHRDAVDGDVEPRGVGSAQAHRRAADADARFVGGDHRGSQRQHRRNVESVAVAGDHFVRKVGIGDRRAARCARGGHLDLLQAVHAHGVFGPGRAGGCRDRFACLCRGNGSCRDKRRGSCRVCGGCGVRYACGEGDGSRSFGRSGNYGVCRILGARRVCGDAERDGRDGK